VQSSDVTRFAFHCRGQLLAPPEGRLWGIKSGSCRRGWVAAMGSVRGPSPGRPATSEMRRNRPFLCTKSSERVRFKAVISKLSFGIPRHRPPVTPGELDRSWHQFLGRYGTGRCSSSPRDVGRRRILRNFRFVVMPRIKPASFPQNRRRPPPTPERDRAPTEGTRSHSRSGSGQNCSKAAARSRSTIARARSAARCSARPRPSTSSKCACSGSPRRC